jgi:hypothetical protein
MLPLEVVGPGGSLSTSLAATLNGKTPVGEERVCLGRWHGDGGIQLRPDCGGAQPSAGGRWQLRICYACFNRQISMINSTLLNNFQHLFFPQKNHWVTSKINCKLVTFRAFDPQEGLQCITFCPYFDPSNGLYLRKLFVEGPLSVSGLFAIKVYIFYFTRLFFRKKQLLKVVSSEN